MDCVDCDDIIETRPAPPTKGLAYTAVNGGFSVSRGTANASIVIIPSEHNEQPVTQIAREGFQGHRDLTNIFIPYGVTTIGAGAFRDCTGLTSIVIPDSVISIEGDVDWVGQSGGAFQGCTGLTSVTIGNGVTTIGDNAFSGCTNLTSITIPNSVETIGDNAFAWCRGLTSVTIGNSVTTIGNRAFEGCSGLTSITIPASVTSIDLNAFQGCTGLTNFFVDESNQSFASQDGILYNKAKIKLIRVILNIGGSFTIPNNVTSIGDWAFSGCTNLTSVTIGNSVTYRHTFTSPFR